MSSILILTGPPGTGKTTAAGAVAGRFARAVHLESDRFFGVVRSGYVEPWKPESHPQNEIVMRAVAAAARCYAEGGYTTIVEGIVLPRWFLEPLRTSFRDAGLGTSYAVLRAPLEICLSRSSARRDQPLSDPDVVSELWRQFADLGPLEPHAIDVSHRTVDEVAATIAARLDDGSLEL